MIGDALLKLPPSLFLRLRAVPHRLTGGVPRLVLAKLLSNLLRGGLLLLRRLRCAGWRRPQPLQLALKA